MEKKEVIIGNPLTVAGITLIPITEILLHSWQHKCGISFLGVKQPLSVVVISPSEKKAFKVSGEEVLLDQLHRRSPHSQREIRFNLTSLISFVWPKSAC